MDLLPRGSQRPAPLLGMIEKDTHPTVNDILVWDACMSSGKHEPFVNALANGSAPTSSDRAGTEFTGIQRSLSRRTSYLFRHCFPLL